MEDVFQNIDEQFSLLKSLPKLSQESQALLDKKFRLEFNYNSNHLEGSSLTYSDTELLLMFDETRGNHNMREYEEMKAHDAAYKTVQELALDPERPFTENFIKDLNRILLVKPYYKDAQTCPSSRASRDD